MTTLLDRKRPHEYGSELRSTCSICRSSSCRICVEYSLGKKCIKTAKRSITLEGVLPHDILYRKKSPYPKTHNPHYTKAITVWLQNLLTDKGSILHELFDKEQLSGLIQSGGSAFQTPWFGQLMTGPQLLAHLAQIHVWFKEYGVNIKE